MHTAVPLGSDQPIDPRRNSFEISASDKFAQLLATARDDLARAESAHLEERFALKKDRDLSFEQLLGGHQATVALEYAPYVARTRACFTPGPPRAQHHPQRKIRFRPDLRAIARRLAAASAPSSRATITAP
jgi:hypothetical protein